MDSDNGRTHKPDKHPERLYQLKWWCCQTNKGLPWYTVPIVLHPLNTSERIMRWKVTAFVLSPQSFTQSCWGGKEIPRVCCCQKDGGSEETRYQRFRGKGDKQSYMHILWVSVTRQTHINVAWLFFFPDSPSSCCTEESTFHGGWFGVTWCKYQCEGPIWKNMSSSQCREWICSGVGGKFVMWCWRISIQNLLLHVHSYCKFFFNFFWQVLKGLMRNGKYINLEERDANGTKWLLLCWFL